MIEEVKENAKAEKVNKEKVKKDKKNIEKEKYRGRAEWKYIDRSESLECEYFPRRK